MVSSRRLRQREPRLPQMANIASSITLFGSGPNSEVVAFLETNAVPL
jgi:hypothetical protein